MPGKLYILIAILLGLYSSSCNTNKLISLESTKAIKRSAEDILTFHDKNNRDFSFFNAKLGADIVTEQFEGSASINLRMKKGEYAWLQVSKLSFEVARAMATPEDVTMVNRIERSYLKEEWSYASNVFGLNLPFEEIQQLMTGNIIIPTKNEITRFQESDNVYQMSFSAFDSDINYVFDSETMLLKTATIESNGQKAEISFDTYQKIEGKLRPKVFTILTDRNEKITFDIKSMEYDSEKEVVFSVPSKYDRVRL